MERDEGEKDKCRLNAMTKGQEMEGGMRGGSQEKDFKLCRLLFIFYLENKLAAKRHKRSDL